MTKLIACVKRGNPSTGMGQFYCVHTSQADGASELLTRSVGGARAASFCQGNAHPRKERKRFKRKTMRGNSVGISMTLTQSSARIGRVSQWLGDSKRVYGPGRGTKRARR